MGNSAIWLCGNYMSMIAMIIVCKTVQKTQQLMLLMCKCWHAPAQLFS